MDFKDYEIIKFIEDLSSDLPSPGGGSVAGLMAALSGSLNSMVYSLTVNKKSFEDLDGETKKMVLDFSEASKKFTIKSLKFMEDDRKYFNDLMKIYKMKKDTEEEKEIRKKAVLEGTLKAMKTPLELCREGYKFYDNIEIAVRYGNKMLLSDAGCAASLLHSVIECSVINVKVNLTSLRSKSFAKGIEEEVNGLLKSSLDRKEKILDIVNKSIYPE
ncbi:cyclodeaminase/cyclohydrolase family protein [uncultured Clostridium sp.]|uniref:cyclodeaminase/cyclohydrolase family protein n=1 Tax=uncultured Clostridium sp. TaxID=59620 RepID=UPI0025D57A7E|nr:cyclodeaminase/cyclohydrolase family protein [uncultured Clostridium sp.]